MEQVIIGSSYGVLFEVGTGYHGLMGRCASTSTGPQAEAIIPSAGTIKKLRVELSAAPGAGKSYTFNLYKNGSAVGTLSAAIADAATSNEDSGSFSVSAGDRFGMHFKKIERNKNYKQKQKKKTQQPQHTQPPQQHNQKQQQKQKPQPITE